MAQILNRTYEILEFIGKGGMSTVFKARHIRLNTEVAIKAVRKDQQIDLLAEVSILTRLNHPNLVKVTDIFEDDKLVYIVMDYIEGEDLQHIIEREKVIPEETVMEWFRTLADTLHYLHTRKPPIIYRDMKPANVILQKDGTLKVIDFGIAREYKAQASGDTTYIGTNGFAAPEQFGLAQSDGRTDIYSLGMTMHYLATGKSPLAPPYGYTPARKLNPAVSPKLEAILEKCIKDNPEDRYQTAEELLKDLNDGNTYPFYTTNALPTSSLPTSVLETSVLPSAMGTTPVEVKVPVQNAPVQEKKKFSPAVIGIICAALAVLIAGVFVLWPRGSSAAVISASSEEDEEEEAVIDDTITAQKGVLKAAISGFYPPFSYDFYDGEEQLGYDVMIAQKIADRLGYELEITIADFGNEAEQLNSDEADLILMCAPEGLHKDTMEESKPYFRHGIFLVFPEGTDFDTKDLAGYVQGKNAAVSDKRDYLADFAEELGMNVTGTISTDAIDQAVKDVKNGKYDCAVFSTEDMFDVYISPVRSHIVMIKQEDLEYYGFEIPADPDGTRLENVVINAKKGNKGLIKVVNQVLNGISPAERQEMWLEAMQQIAQKYLSN